jgi:hypothetical protein
MEQITASRVARAAVLAVGVAVAMTACSTDVSSPSFASSASAVTHARAPVPLHFFGDRATTTTPTLRRSHFTEAVLYGGGSIHVVPYLWVIFWGIAGPSDLTHDPDHVASYLTSFYRASAGSPWLNTMTQYSMNVGGKITYVQNPKLDYGQTWYDSSLPPRSFTNANIQAEVEKAFRHFGPSAYTVNNTYVVVTPSGYAESDIPASTCAYHSAIFYGAYTLAYDVLPYTPDRGRLCGAYTETASVLDGVSIVAGHELAETQTDPVPYKGWADTWSQEIGDKCAWQLREVTFPNGSKFAVQLLWSNATMGCVESYP